MFRNFRLLTLLAVLGFTVFALQARSSVEAQDDAAALEVIEAINAWRIEEGLWPLKPNATLTQMAIDQATYILSLPDIPDDIHIDKNGKNPRERALDYNWPHYSLPGQIAIGENGASGSLDYAMNFWHESHTHRETTLNPAYREIGVAALPNKFGHFYIVEFGGRPDVLPALADPASGTLYLANEKFQWASAFTAMKEAKEVRLFDVDGRPLSTDWLPWADTMPIPENAGSTILVLYSDGTNESMSIVNLTTDVVLLPGGATVVAQPPAEEAAPDTTREDQPPLEESTADTTAQESVVGATAAISIDIRILYTANTLNLVNVSGDPLDMSGITLSGSGQTLPLEQFTRVADFSLAGVPNHHCLQARDSTLSGDVVLPEGCTWARSLLYVNPGNLFWATGDFTVQRGEVTLATCTVGAGVCEVDIP